MKILSKISIILIMIVSMCMVLPNNYSQASVSSIVKEMKAGTVEDSLSSKLRSTLRKLLGFLQVASGLISVVTIAFTGFQYIVAETPNIKDELKKKMLPIIIGLVIVFSASSITQFILGVVE